MVITIDEPALAATRRRSPIDRTFLAKLLERLNEAQPAAIGVDILFDRSTTEDEDDHLIEQLHTMRVPVTLADGSPMTDPDQITPEQATFLSAFCARVDNPLVKPGLVRLTRDPDGAIRQVPPPSGIGSDRQETLTMSTELAAHAGAPPLQPGTRIAYYGEFMARSVPDAAQQGSVVINETFPFKTLPALAVVAAPQRGWDLLKRQLAGNIVLVGVSVLDWDRVATPFTFVNRDTTPGVMIHASLVAQMIDGRWLRVSSVMEDTVITILLVGFGFGIGVRSDNNAMTFGLVGGLVLAYWGFCVAAYWIPVAHGHGRSLYPMIWPAVATMIATFLGYALTRRRFQAQRDFIEGALGKYVSPSIAEQLLAHPERLKVGGERRVVTVMFTDIEGFTRLSESLEPTALVEILNKYLNGMTRIVHDHEGTLDKYIGDALVALWNAPLERIDHAAKAVDCAVALADFADAFAQEQAAAGIAFGRTRIGVHTGVAIVGNFGGEEKLNYTAIGDTINLASRLEGANKFFRTRILIGDQTANASARDDLRPVADIVVKGREEAVTVFEPVPSWAPDLRARYRLAYRMVHNHDPGALGAVDALAAFGDPVIDFYHKRLSLGQLGTHIVLEDK